MLKTPLFIWIFITVAIVAALHLSALQFYLYWRFWWFDLLTHFLGGLWVAVSFCGYFFNSVLLIYLRIIKIIICLLRFLALFLSARFGKSLNIIRG